MHPSFLKWRARELKEWKSLWEIPPEPCPGFEFVSIRASIRLESSVHIDSCKIMFSPVFSIIFVSTLQNARKSIFDSHIWKM